MVNQTHLKSFLMVAQRGSFAAAGRRLGYTASAISQQIAALEQDLQVQLFEREPKGIRLTAVGREYMERAEPVVAVLIAFDQEVSDRRQGTAGKVRIGSFPTASRVLLPGALAALRTTMNGLDVILDEGEPDQLLGDLIMRDLDIVIAYEYDLVPRAWPDGARVTRLLSEDLTLLLPAGHPLADGEVDASELRGEAWVSTREGTSGEQALQRWSGALGIIPDIRFRSNDYEVVAAFVRAGLGIALVPALGRTGDHGIVPAKVRDLAVRRHISVVTFGDTGAPAAVADALSGVTRTLAEGVPGLHAHP